MQSFGPLDEMFWEDRQNGDSEPQNTTSHLDSFKVEQEATLAYSFCPPSDFVVESDSGYYLPTNPLLSHNIYDEGPDWLYKNSQWPIYPQGSSSFYVEGQMDPPPTPSPLIIRPYPATQAHGSDGIFHGSFQGSNFSIPVGQDVPPKIPLDPETDIDWAAFCNDDFGIQPGSKNLEDHKMIDRSLDFSANPNFIDQVSNLLESVEPGQSQSQGSPEMTKQIFSNDPTEAPNATILTGATQSPTPADSTKDDQLSSCDFAVVRPMCFRAPMLNALEPGSRVEDDSGTEIDVKEVKFTSEHRLLTVLGKSEKKLTRYMFCTQLSCDLMMTLSIKQGTGMPRQIPSGFGHDPECRKAAAGQSNGSVRLEDVYGSCRGCITGHLANHRRLTKKNACKRSVSQSAVLDTLRSRWDTMTVPSWVKPDSFDPRAGIFTCSAQDCNESRTGIIFNQKQELMDVALLPFFAHTVKCFASVLADHPGRDKNTIARWCSSNSLSKSREHLAIRKYIRTRDTCHYCSRAESSAKKQRSLLDHESYGSE